MLENRPVDKICSNCLPIEVRTSCEELFYSKPNATASLFIGHNSNTSASFPTSFLVV